MAEEDYWYIACPSSDVSDGQIRPSRILGQDIVLWRSHGKIRAFQDLCIHRGARLSLGWVDEQERLVCPYHGFRYNEAGECVMIPASGGIKPPSKARARSFMAEDRYGVIWVSLGAPVGDIPPFPEWESNTNRTIFVGKYAFKNSAPRVMENLLDIAHFPFVHAGILGDPEKAELGEYDVLLSREGMVVSNIKVWQPEPDATKRLSSKMLSYTYRMYSPFSMSLLKNPEEDEKRWMAWISVTPVDPNESLLWVWVSMNYGFDVPEEQVRARQDTLMRQDIRIVESQRPELLPLDLAAELSLRFDKASIAYRKWLREIGVTFGTS